MYHSRFMFTLLIAALAYADAVSEDGMAIRVGVLADFVESQSNVRPADGKRLFTLQPSRDRSLGLMQGHAEITGSSPSIWWRVALQDGWFPDVNYTGADYDWRFLQEASVGLRASDRLTISGGVMPSHIGYESMIARDNLTLSRSFTADNTPYYETGLSGTYSASDKLSISVLLLNGWQRIVDNNDDLSIGTAVKWQPDSSVTLSWNTYVGNDQPRDRPSLVRFHNNIWCEWKATDKLALVGLLDLGLQQRPNSGTSTLWYTGFVSRYTLSASFRLAGRVEHYADPDAVIVQTPLGGGFVAASASLNADYDVTENILGRVECRRVDYNGLFINARTDNASSSETYITLSISARFTTRPL